MNFLGDNVFQMVLNTLDRLNAKSEEWQLEISESSICFVRRDHNGDDWESICSDTRDTVGLITLCYKVFQEKLT